MNSENKPTDPKVYSDYMQGQAEGRATNKYHTVNKQAGEYVVNEIIKDFSR